MQEMANYRRRNGAAQKKDVLNKRSTIFWSKMSVNRMESRKKDCSGLTQLCSEIKFKL